MALTTENILTSIAAGISGTPIANGFDLRWGEYKGSVDGYNIYLDGASTPHNGTLITGNTYQITGLGDETEHTVRLSVVISGEETFLYDPLKIKTADVTAPLKPTINSAYSGESSIILGYRPDPADPDTITRWNIYIDGVKRGPFQGRVREISDNVAAGNTYSVQVSALDNAGNESTLSDAVNVTVEADPPQYSVGFGGTSADFLEAPLNDLLGGQETGKQTLVVIYKVRANGLSNLVRSMLGTSGPGIKMRIRESTYNQSAEIIYHTDGGLLPTHTPLVWRSMSVTCDRYNIDYYDSGSLDESDSYSDVRDMPPWEAALRIGAGDQYPCGSEIAEVRYYSRDLSTSEIRDIRDGKAIANDQDLVALWNFHDQLSGGVAKDLMNGFDLTVNGDVYVVQDSKNEKNGPPDFEVIPRGTGFMVRWGFDDKGDAEQYNVYLDGVQQNSEILLEADGEREWEITGLTPGTSYTVRAETVHDDGSTSFKEKTLTPDIDWGATVGLLLSNQRMELVDNAGAQQWRKLADKTNVFNGMRDIQMDPAGNLYGLGYEYAGIAKFTESGMHVFNLRNSTFDQARKLDIGLDGAFYVAADEFSNNFLKFNRLMGGQQTQDWGNPRFAVAVDKAGNIYTGDENGFVYRRNPSFGSDWTSADLGGNIYGLALNVANDGLYVVSRSTGLFKLDPVDGSTLWSDTTNLTDPARVEVDKDGNVIVVDVSTDIMYKFDETGALVDQTASIAGMSNLAVGNDGFAYTNSGSVLYKIDLSDMSQAWSYDAGQSISAIATKGGRAGVFG